MIAQQDLEHILAHTQPLWEKLRKKRIFLTGGTGFFGKWFLESFIWANTHLDLHAGICVLSRNPSSFKTFCPHLFENPSIIFYQGDVRSFIFPQDRFDFVIHAATDVNTQLHLEDPLLIVDTIVEGTRKVLEFALHCGAKQFLLTSSGAVYGKQPTNLLHIPEDYPGAPDPTQPVSVYGEAKRLAELLCAVYQKQYGLNVVIARCFASLGPYLHLNFNFAAGNFIRDALAGKAIYIQGDGTPHRSYIYAADQIVWLWTILFDGKPGRPYNVGSDQSLSIEELARRISRCFQEPLGVIITQNPVPGQNPARYVPSINRAKNELGLQCWIDLDEAIQRTVLFCQQNHKKEAVVFSNE